MFTGIVEEIGRVAGTKPGSLTIKARKVVSDLHPGDSISVNGACLTATLTSKSGFSVDIMAETVRRSNLGRLRYGDLVNLERPVATNGRFGGHFVQGHVDDVGTILSLSTEEDAVIARIAAPSHLMPYIVDKGFIAVDGVSLTVVGYDDASFRVSLVGYTREHTTFSSSRPGDQVNLEVDIIAKYVERIRERRDREITLDFLEEHGFSRAR